MKPKRGNNAKANGTKTKQHSETEQLKPYKTAQLNRTTKTVQNSTAKQNN
jgi:hypothetical protein